MKVLCIGHASYDISMYINSYPKENRKYRLKEQLECAGGSALIQSLLLSKWGVDTYFMGVVGKDECGSKIINTLKENNVNTDYMIISENVETTKTFILVNKESATRTLFNTDIKCDNLTHKEFDFIPDIILMDSEHYPLAIEAINKFPNAIKILDAGKVSDEVMSLAKLSDYVVCSKEFASIVTKIRLDYKNPDTLKEVINNLESIYKNVIVTCEEKGSLYKLDDKIKLMGSLKVEAKDTTAAGDIFHGAFAYGISKSLPLEKCLKIANIAASLSVKEYGSSTSIPKVEEVYKIYEKNR